MFLNGMRLRYDATNGAYIDEVRLYLIDGSKGSASASSFDTTNRSDELCRTYGLPATIQFNTDDFWYGYQFMKSQGVHFHEEPRNEPYGMIVVFSDLYGNKWDLLEQIVKNKVTHSL